MVETLGWSLPLFPSLPPVSSKYIKKGDNFKFSNLKFKIKKLDFAFEAADNWNWGLRCLNWPSRSTHTHLVCQKTLIILREIIDRNHCDEI